MSSEAIEHLVSEFNKFKQMAVVTVSEQDMHDILNILTGDKPDKMPDEINLTIDTYVSELKLIGENNRKWHTHEKWYATKVVDLIALRDQWQKFSDLIQHYFEGCKTREIICEIRPLC